MDNQVKRQNANKISPNGKKLSGVQKKEGIAENSHRIERRQANVKGLSRKYEAKPSHFNYTGCKETRHTCLVVSPPELEKPSANDADDDEKADTKVAIESSVMKLKDEQQAYDKQSSSCKSYTSKVKLLTSLRRSTKSRSPSTRGKKTRLHFEAKERNVRTNKFGRVAVRNLSPKVSRAPAVPEKKTNKVDSENIIIDSEASGNLRPLCLPFGTAYSNESSAVYPLESLESIESISDLFDNCESFSNNIPTCNPPRLADNPNNYCPIEAKQKDLCVEKSYDKLVEEHKRTADKFCVESSQCSHEHCHADDRYIKTLENSKLNDDFKTCDENTDLNLESKEVVIEKMNFCWEEKDSLDIHSHGDEVLALADRRFAKESLESHISTNQTNGEGISEGMNLIEGEEDDLDEQEIPEKLCLQTYAKSKEGEAFQVCKDAQKRKNTELFKVHVHVHARSHQTAHTMSPNPNVKNTKEIVRSHGETVFQKSSAISRGNRKETVKSRDGTKLEANCDYGKETFSFLQAYKMSDIQKYAYRLSPSPSIALKQKQVNLASCGTFLKTSAPTAQRTASCRMSRSSLISEQNSDKSLKLNKATVLDLPKESPKIQTENNNMKHAQLAGREKNYNLYGSGVDRDRSSPEKRSRLYSKSVVPSRCQNEMTGSTKLHSAPYKSHPMSTKTAPQKFSQKTSTKNQSSSVVKINYSRGGDQKIKSIGGASLHITPLYGKARSGSDKCGPHFLENLAHLTAQSNESSNKSTEGIFSRTIFQPRKTQNMSSHPKQLKTAVCSSSLLLLKSKSLVAQNSHVDNFSIKKANSACSTSRAERERKASRDRDARAAVTLKTAHIYSNESIDIEKKETSRVETTCAEKSKTQLSKKKIPATKNITSTVRIKDASSEKRNVSRPDKVNDRKGKEATESIKNVRKDFSKEFSNEESQHLTKHCKSTRNFVENLAVSQLESQEELMPQSVVQETKEMKQCCIRVSTIQEAKDVAKSLMTSAYKDLMTANRWVSCNEDVSMVSTENVDFMEALRKFELASQVKQSKDAEDKMPPRLSANIHLSKDMTRKEMESLDDEERPLSRLKHCRRATASFGEINLLDTLVDSPLQNTDEKHTVNVRKIDFEPMICIPLANSESAIKVDHQDIGIDCQSLCLIKDLCKSPLGAENSAKGDDSQSLQDAFVQKGNENEMCPIRNASDDQLKLSTTNKQQRLPTCMDESQFKADVLTNHDDAINVVYEYPIDNIINPDVDESDCRRGMIPPTDKDFTESSNLIANSINNYDYVTEVEASGPNSFPSGSEKLNSFVKRKQSDEDTTKICSSGQETFVGQEKKETSPSASNSCSTNCSCHAVDERSPLIAQGDHNQEAEDSESDDAKKSDSNEVISNAETTGITDPQSLEETLTVTLVEKVNHYLANVSHSVEWNNKTLSSESGASLLFERTQSLATLAKNAFDLTDFGTKWTEKITSDQKLKKTSPSYHSFDNTQSVVASSTDLNTNPDQGCASNRSSFIKSSEASFHSIVSSCGDEASLASIVVKVPVKDFPCEFSSGSAANPNLNPSQHMADNLDYASAIPTSNRPTLDVRKLNLDTTSNHRTMEIYPEESHERASNSSASLPSSPNRAALVVTTASPTYSYSPRTNFPNSNIIVTSINKSPRDRNRLEVSELQELFESLSSRKSPIIASFKNETREIQTTPKVSKHTKGEYKGKDSYPPYRSPRKVEVDNLTTWTNNSLDLTGTATLIDHTRPVGQDSGKKIKLNISDLSTDSFNSLFIENAMYLEDVSRLNRAESQLASRSIVPRKLKVKKLSFHKKSGKDEDGKERNSRIPSAQTSIGTGGGIEERENSWSSSEEKTTSLAQEAAYFEGQFSPTTESNRITEFESPTLCLSEITDCNNTKSSFTEGLRSSGNKPHETHLSKFSRQELRSRYEQARQNFQEIRASDEANEGYCFSKTSPSSVVSHRVQVRQQDSDGLGAVTNEEVDPGLVWSKVDEMEARRRRRLLERAADVSSEDSPSWRSKVYQKETAEDSLTGRRDRAESRLAQPFSQNEETKERVLPGLRSRRGDDSGNNDLAERLARRRAQRLEEQAESSSLDGSADGNRLMGRRWSRDESVRSIDSSENGDANTGVISSRRTRRSDDDYFSNITRNCSEENENVEGSIRSENSAEKSGRRRSQRHRKSDNSEPHYWNSKDSANGFSVSSDTGDAFARRHSRDTDSLDESSVNVLDRKGRRQQPSKDSAFSEPRDKSAEDVSFDLNNSNNNSSAQKVLLEETMLSAKALRDRRIEDFINDCVETESAAKDKACVGNSNGSPYHHQQKPADHNFSHSQEQSKPTIAAPSEKQDSSFNGKDEDKPCEEDNQVLSNFKARLLRLRGVETDDTECLKENSEEVTMPPETRSIQESHKTEIYSENSIPEISQTNNATNNVDTTAESVLASCTPNASSATLEVEKKSRRRVDKSALRKSPLNMSTGSTDVTDGKFHLLSSVESLSCKWCC
ncbi:hypothetical protein Bpfe_024760 [Biomphalaria pfeifferi]|uniref:Uncharacterized protein n=1 Tax=Biomphalaria pfeifferi TaxID=112525 RepID=A0AAD8B0D8_BIOPF|nr:hypothetical protein Bpfe_024760 [Biomphalaria pfeifferi]